MESICLKVDSFKKEKMVFKIDYFFLNNSYFFEKRLIGLYCGGLCL